MVVAFKLVGIVGLNEFSFMVHFSVGLYASTGGYRGAATDPTSATPSSADEVSASADPACHPAAPGRAETNVQPRAPPHSAEQADQELDEVNALAT